jgi:hypothetical protein
MKATAKYIPDTPGAGDIGELTIANLERSVLIRTRIKKILRYVDKEFFLDSI